MKDGVRYSQENGMTKCKCDNCRHVCDSIELREARDLDERLDYPLGHELCIEPAGECPECGCLSYEIGNKDNAVARKKRRIVDQALATYKDVG